MTDNESWRFLLIEKNCVHSIREGKKCQKPKSLPFPLYIECFRNGYKRACPIRVNAEETVQYKFGRDDTLIGRKDNGHWFQKWRKEICVTLKSE